MGKSLLSSTHSLDLPTIDTSVFYSEYFSVHLLWQVCVCVCVCKCVWIHACMLSCFCHVQLFVNIWTVARQAPLSMGQEYWSRLPCPPSGDLPDSGTESVSPVSPVLQADSLPTEPSGKTHMDTYMALKIQVGSCSTCCLLSLV